MDKAEIGKVVVFRSAYTGRAQVGVIAQAGPKQLTVAVGWGRTRVRRDRLIAVLSLAQGELLQKRLRMYADKQTAIVEAALAEQMTNERLAIEDAIALSKEEGKA